MTDKKFIDKLINLGWKIEGIQNSADSNYAINDTSEKLEKTTEQFTNFIKTFSTLANKEDNIWFISYKDYFETESDDGFSWNDFELESIEYAEPEEVESIKNFWSSHLPFIISVKNGYAYAALVLDGDKKGSVVAGNEPMYEETEEIATSLSDFFEKYTSILIDGKSIPGFKMLV